MIGFAAFILFIEASARATKGSAPAKPSASDAGGVGES
jgi:hypothetical protein